MYAIIIYNSVTYLNKSMWCKFSKMTAEQRRERKLKMYNFFEDSLEERLAGVKAAKAKLKEQMTRHATENLHDDMKAE